MQYMPERIGPDELATVVLAVLCGTALHRAAADIGMPPANLADAMEVYQAAGTAALHAHAAARDWYEVRIQFPDWDAAEHTAATHLGPHLQHAQGTGALTGWWFIRKAPCWRLRCRPGPTTTVDDVRSAITSILYRLTVTNLIDGWSECVYEPETLAFGGPPGMHVAHDLFHADSAAILDYLRQHEVAPTDAIGRRELSILLCTALFRGAGQEWHEHGDIWHRVTALRPLPADVPAHRIGDLTAGLQALMSADTNPTGPLFGGPLAFAVPWAAAFTDAGHALGTAARDGTLGRGLRHTLAHHVIFHWNRLGLPARTQSLLAHAACDAVMNPTTGRLDGTRSLDVAGT